MLRTGRYYMCELANQGDVCPCINLLCFRNLANSGLTGQIPTRIGELVSLTKLDLAGNSLDGEIPYSIGNMSLLIDLGLNDNKLNGSIPDSLGSLLNLTRINLGNNSLSGIIPSSIGSLFALTSLYLDSNQLSGEIPSTLSNLFLLTDLSIDNNQLTGPVPQLLQVSTCSVSNNSGICEAFERSSACTVGLQTCTDCQIMHSWQPLRFTGAETGCCSQPGLSCVNNRITQM
jgi:hypothetical protein